MANWAYDSMTGSLWQNVVDNARAGGSNWSPHPISGGVFRIFENRAYCEFAGVIYHEATPPSADYAVQATYYLWTDEGTEGIAGRISTAALSYYATYYANGNVVLVKVVAGAISVLALAAVPWAAGTHTLRLEMVGAGLGVYWDGDEVITTVDSSITAAGHAGIRSGAPNDARKGKHIDTFLAADDTTLAIGLTRMVGIVGL